MIAATVMLSLTVAFGHPQAAARRHFERAEKLYAVERFQEALGEYEAAYQTRPLPGFLFNIGQCYRNLGNWRQAVFAFKKYLQQKPDARNREAVQNLIDDIERRISEEDQRVPPPPPAPRPPSLEVRPASVPTPAPGFVPTPRAEPRTEPAPPPPRPIYARWWFWTVAGVAVAGGTAAAIVATSTSSANPRNIDFPR
jgi:tetratricopeptide (TPR) repeat protein